MIKISCLIVNEEEQQLMLHLRSESTGVHKSTISREFIGIGDPANCLDIIQR